ncbi:MAG TPA: hypothetical protein VGV17_04240 [Bosea sp. (in: a-proteobacteria)]|uniref:hypothetical protein n=1 Tax=Bosea sp. (in: a-proteobacteria) TaxID=1871050 RepID=UPI002DDDB403|nr:hypothetical protein [Bosea sp. (in: a-proteobacteria)]HEV2552957.1 hypothetical protein [Bosea sp. (in: a-proteobacteria)]
MTPVHIGLDLDNTIIDYSSVFAPIAAELGLLPQGHGLRSKDEIKSRLRDLAGDDTLWMRLQGQVYGKFIGLARPYDGAIAAIRGFRAAGHRVSIVSHKTRLGHFDPDHVDLWDAASGWLATNGLVGEAGPIAPSDVHYRVTREEKVDTISRLDFALFVDDLPEVLGHPNFPASLPAILFSPDGEHGADGRFRLARSWQEVMDMTAGLV